MKLKNYYPLSMCCILSIMLLILLGCNTPDYKGTGEIDYSTMVEKASQMQDYLDNSEFGETDGTYPVSAGEDLSEALGELQLGISKARAGVLLLQYEVDMYVANADRDIASFLNTYQETLPAGTEAELLVFGTYGRGHIEFGTSPKFTEGQTWTVEFWMKLDENFDKGPMGDIISTFNAKSDGYEGWSVNFMGDALRTTIGMGPQYDRVLEWGMTYTYANDEWKHIAAVYDGNAATKQLKMYLNGELFWEKDNDIYDGSSTLQSYAPATADMQMWAFQRPTNTECSVVGYIKKFRLWSVAKSASDLQTIMGTDVDGTESGLTCAWDFTSVPEDSSDIPDKTGKFSAKIVDMHKWYRIE